MTTAASAFPLVGSQPVGNFFIPDTTQRHVLGSVISYNDPYWGGGEAVYLQMPISTALKVGTVMSYDTATSFVAAAVANTANLGKSVAVLMNAVASNAVAQFAWCQVSGSGPVFANATVTADTSAGIFAAGQLGANSAGKQILNARVTKPATTTVVKANTVTTNGSAVLRCTVGAGTDGWFVGVAVTGTGIPASTTISTVNPDNTVVMSANATATGAVSVTGTYNDGTNFWNVMTYDRPAAQGAIT